MPNQRDSIKILPPAGSAVMGGGAVLGSVATGMPFSPALADALAMQGDQVAVAGDFWGSVAAVHASGNMPTHPDQGSLFDPR